MLVIALLAAGSARADGTVSLRGAYYKERSTRVQQPMLDASFDAGAHGQVRGHLLVDSITSASTAAGAGGVPFNEKRYEAGVGYTHQLPAHVKLGGELRYSTESDYVSLWASGAVEVALFDQLTTVRLMAGHGSDDISNGVTVMMGSLGTPLREEQLATTMGSLGVAQVLSPRLVAGLTYDLMLLDGYQANIYRVVRGGSEPVPERVPDTRVRHALFASLRAYLPTRTTAIVGYRFYADDWGIVAHTPEVRLVQEIVPGLELRARYRYFTQSAADFYKPVYMQAELSDPAAFVTEDEKLSAFHTQTIGGQLAVTLGLFGMRDGWRDVRLDAVVERILQTTSFGDAWVGQVGLAVPFSY